MLSPKPQPSKTPRSILLPRHFTVTVSRARLPSLPPLHVPSAPLEPTAHSLPWDSLRESASQGLASTLPHHSQQNSTCAPAQTSSTTPPASKKKVPTSA